ncbi:hypothetical protein SEUCBS140593_008941 [Sporothrix eucalyptigena]|uniref:SnoaL-like domain-containing protein n=1 Tax=Sporothrix eucalyptigena TaxID=1812306 RepID=A0ABP0CT00_9PEZI
MPSTEGAVLATVDAFLASFSDVQPPFTATLTFVKSDSYAVLSHPSGIIQSNLAELIASWEEDLTKVYASGVTSASESAIAPGPEAWVAPTGDFAAVWTGFGFKINGDEKIRGVYALALTKTEEKWTISGLADKMWPSSKETPATVVTASDLTGPVEALLAAVTGDKTSEAEALLLPKGGATAAGVSQSWTEAFVTLKAKAAQAEASTWVYRAVAEVGFVWTGELAFTLLNKDEKWYVSGVEA